MSFKSQPNVYTSATLETVSLVTGSSALPFGASLLGLIAENVSGSTGWIQIFDGYAAPQAGAVPIVSIKVDTGKQVSLDTTAFSCVPVKTGIVVVLSSTGPTYTAVATELFTTAFWN